MASGEAVSCWSARTATRALTPRTPTARPLTSTASNDQHGGPAARRCLIKPAAERAAAVNANWLRPVGLPPYDAVGLTAAEDIADHPGELALIRRLTVRSAPVALTGAPQGGRHEVVVSARRARESREDRPGDHLGERVASAEIGGEHLQQRGRVHRELPAVRVVKSGRPRQAHELEAQPLMQISEHGNIRLAVRPTEQLRVPPARPPLGRFAHDHPGERVGLRERTPSRPASSSQRAVAVACSRAASFGFSSLAEKARRLVRITRRSR